MAQKHHCVQKLPHLLDVVIPVRVAARDAYTEHSTLCVNLGKNNQVFYILAYPVKRGQLLKTQFWTSLQTSNHFSQGCSDPEMICPLADWFCFHNPMRFLSLFLYLGTLGFLTHFLSKSLLLCLALISASQCFFTIV